MIVLGVEIRPDKTFDVQGFDDVPRADVDEAAKGLLGAGASLVAVLDLPPSRRDEATAEIRACLERGKEIRHLPIMKRQEIIVAKPRG